MPGDPFHIVNPPNAPLVRAALTAARPLLSWTFGLRTYRSLYERIRTAPEASFEDRALAALDIEAIWSPSDIDAIPTHGPLVIAANHPHGAVDGLALASILRRTRPDVRLLANRLLARIPELQELCFFVDPFGGAAADARSRPGLRAAHLWLKTGGALIVFPSGEVAHDRRPDGSYADSPWHPTVARLVQATGAQVVPAFIAGANSKGFYAAGRVHPALRTLLLPRELLKKRGQTVTVRLGPALPNLLPGPDRDPVSTTRRIRTAVERLAGSAQVSGRSQPRVDTVADEVAQLPVDSLLVESGAMQVFCVEARQIPSVLREIGRLREVTYRAIGEGTGRSLDLDRFDDGYLHLFSWNRDRREIVGAYRLGLTDRIIAREGVDGLYTRSLFRYDERLITRLSPALELGRSFVRAEYQKNYNALLLLWKGIGHFVVRHPRYRVLFGPVSISARYTDTSQQLLMAFLRQNHLDGDLAELVATLDSHAVKLAPVSTGVPRSIDEANRLIARAESDGKGVPVLLRQYLKLNARLLGFSVDPAFGDALDALMMVDLTRVDPGILNRYLGRHQAIQFLARHRQHESADAA